MLQFKNVFGLPTAVYALLLLQRAAGVKANAPIFSVSHFSQSISK